MITLLVNGKQFDVGVEPDMPLLWALRDSVGLTIDAQMTNACRCGTYYRMRLAVHRAAALLSGSGEKA
jgi:aerobic-type carbon monoxide dehydrogenase small subunit (CoxS/CutS family)